MKGELHRISLWLGGAMLCWAGFTTFWFTGR